MALTKILIVVKTYPTLSEKYDELVCTAGFREDGTWVRIFPVPFRKLNYARRYKKWQWIELDLVKNTSDYRPESYRPRDIDNEIKILEEVDTKYDWAERKKIALGYVYSNMTELLADTKKNGTSLAVLKPTEILKFICEPCDREWNKTKMAAVLANQAQGSLFDFEETKKMFEVAKKVPYKFSYVFKSADGIVRTMMIEDWELGMLYWNCLNNANGDEKVACEKVKEKYFDWMLNKCDLYFFLGTTKQFHNVAPNPYIIIGTFYPPQKDRQQLSLFE